jgi:GNAT superfamily N-acetyltransferase
MNDYTLSIEDNPTHEETSAVEAALHEYNRRHVPGSDWKRLTVLLRAADGRVVGGLRGETYWGWLYVDTLAIRDEARNRGYGSQLLALAEQEALARGCHHAYLDTMSFQALPFYEKQGYTVFGTLERFPDAHRRYFLQKELRPL